MTEMGITKEAWTFSAGFRGVFGGGESGVVTMAL